MGSEMIRRGGLTGVSTSPLRLGNWVDSVKCTRGAGPLVRSGEFCVSGVFALMELRVSELFDSEAVNVSAIELELPMLPLCPPKLRMSPGMGVTLLELVSITSEGASLAHFSAMGNGISIGGIAGTGGIGCERSFEPDFFNVLLRRKKERFFFTEDSER